MKSNWIKKILGVFFSITMLLCMVSCDTIKKSSFDESGVEEVISSYLSLIKKTKFSKAASLVDGETDYYTDADLCGFQMDILEAVLASTDYEISDIESKKNDSATCTVELEIPDIKDLKTDSDFLDNIADADKKNEEFTIKFICNDDTWLIKDAKDIADALINPLESYVPETADIAIEPVDVTEESDITVEEAIDFFENQLYEFNNATLESVYEDNLKNNPNLDYETFVAENSGFLDFVIAFLSATDIEYEVSSSDSSKVVFDVTCYIPVVDTNALLVYIANDSTIISSTAGSFIQEPLKEDEYIRAIVDFINVEKGYTIEPVYTTYVVSRDENGEIVGDDGIAVAFTTLFDPINAINDENIFSNKSFSISVCDYANYVGYITDDEYIELMNRIDAYYNSEIIVIEGSEFESIEFYTDDSFETTVDAYNEGTDGFYIRFKTTEYYQADDIYSIKVYSGTNLISEGSAANGYDNSNIGNIVISSDMVKGNYRLVIYGYNGLPFASVMFVVR